MGRLYERDTGFKRRADNASESDWSLYVGLGLVAAAGFAGLAVIDNNKTDSRHATEAAFIAADGFEVKSMPKSVGEMLGDIATSGEVKTVLSFGTCDVAVTAAETHSASGALVGVEDYAFMSDGQRIVVQNRSEFDAEFGADPCDRITAQQ